MHMQLAVQSFGHSLQELCYAVGCLCALGLAAATQLLGCLDLAELPLLWLLHHKAHMWANSLEQTLSAFHNAGRVQDCGQHQLALDKYVQEVVNSALVMEHATKQGMWL